MYILGNVTLPNPKVFTREFVETSAENMSIEGKSTKRVENRRERFILNFQYLTSAQVNAILSEYQLNAVRNFTVAETNLTIGPTEVLIDIKDREFTAGGTIYRENITLVLTEIK